MTDTPHLIEDLEQIFSTLRHEFGNTVNTLNMTLDVLISNYGMFNDTTRLEFLHRALEQVERQNRFLDAMRSYAHAVAGESQEMPTIFFWEECVDQAMAKLSGKPIHLKQRIESEHNFILINPSAVYEVLGHLFDNAIDAVSEIESPEIELLAYTHPGSLLIQVLDNGPGIPDDIRSKVVLPFFTTREGHSGFGLSISRKMLSQMEGRLELVNRLPSGTQASMWLKID